MSVEELDALPAEEAADLFRSCCGASAWVSAMVAQRPFKSANALLAAADDVWINAHSKDWKEAFDYHPRIGESSAAAQQTDRAREMSVSEQALARLASSNVHDQMSLVNLAYERKFGFIYVVSAAGKDARELLDIARKRLKNDPETELRVAAEEQRMITRLRLQKLLGVAT
jgi:OHCU decarboxylase